MMPCTFILYFLGLDRCTGEMQATSSPGAIQHGHDSSLEINKDTIPLDVVCF